MFKVFEMFKSSNIKLHCLKFQAIPANLETRDCPGKLDPQAKTDPTVKREAPDLQARLVLRDFQAQEVNLDSTEALGLKGPKASMYDQV